MCLKFDREFHRCNEIFTYIVTPFFTCELDIASCALRKHQEVERIGEGTAYAAADQEGCYNAPFTFLFNVFGSCVVSLTAKCHDGGCTGSNRVAQSRAPERL